jgi:hypothetical protein
MAQEFYRNSAPRAQEQGGGMPVKTLRLVESGAGNTEERRRKTDVSRQRGRIALQ